MHIDTIKIRPWDGTTAVILTPALGFNYSEARYKNHFIDSNVALLWNDSDVDVELIRQLLDTIQKNKSVEVSSLDS